MYSKYKYVEIPKQPLQYQQKQCKNQTNEDELPKPKKNKKIKSDKKDIYEITNVNQKYILLRNNMYILFKYGRIYLYYY